MGADLAKKLNSIGASYFISYLYSKYVDKSHNAYKNRDTELIGVIEKLKPYYYEMIRMVLDMDEGRLNNNSIGLAGQDIKKMAEELEKLFSSYSPVGIHIQSSDYISLSDLSEVSGLINDGLKGAFINKKLGNDDIIIKEVNNGSILLDLLIGVGASLIATGIMELIQYIRNKNRNDNYLIMEIRFDNNHNVIEILLKHNGIT